MSAPGIFTPPKPVNEPIKTYEPGSPERAELQGKLKELESERMRIPMIIGGKDVYTDETFEAVEPHHKSHVLADVSKGGPEHVQQAIDAARAAHEEWSRMPWHDRIAVFLRASELLAGPWRATLNAATMLNQSKTVHQAEIDAVGEMVDFWRYNAEFVVRIYSEQPYSPTGTWNRLEYRPLEGFVFAVSPFNFTCIGGNLSSSPALMGNTVIWKPASTAVCSAYFLMRLMQAAGLPDGVINLVFGSGATIGDAALGSSELAGIHFTGSTEVFNGMWHTVGANVGSYRNYPRIVGETGGEGFLPPPPPHRRHHGRLRGLLRAADSDRDGRQGLPAPARRALRTDRHDVRLRREALGRHARPGRPDSSLRPHGGGVRDRGGGRSASVHGGEPVRERQADRRGRRPTTVRRFARERHERQGRLDVES